MYIASHEALPRPTWRTNTRTTHPPTKRFMDDTIHDTRTECRFPMTIYKQCNTSSASISSDFLQVSTVRNFDYHRNCCSHSAWGWFFCTRVDRTKFRLSSELLLPCCMGMLFSYKCRPYEISIIIGIVAPMLHGDDFVLQVSTVRNFDYHRKCCSHAAWGWFCSTSVARTKFRLSSEFVLPCCMGMTLFYKCRPYEISIIIGIVAPMLHGDVFFSTSVARTKFRLSSELLLPCCMGLIFLYTCRPCEISIIIGIVAPTPLRGTVCCFLAYLFTVPLSSWLKFYFLLVSFSGHCLLFLACLVAAKFW